jgi:hypothetical protein
MPLKLDDKILPTDLTLVFKEIGKVKEQIAMLNIPDPVELTPIYEILTGIEKTIAILSKENEVQDAEIEEIKIQSRNPLGG